MLKYALLIFLVAAMGGLFMASYVLRGRLAPWAVSLLHALLGAAGLMVLGGSLLLGDAGTLPIVALCVLVMTALLGFYLASLHYGQKVAMRKVVLTHAGCAVTGVTVLLIAVLLG